MSNSEENPFIRRCYKCNSEIYDLNQVYCQNCHTLLNPNDLKWRNSFLLCISLFCLIPFLIALISISFMKK